MHRLFYLFIGIVVAFVLIVWGSAHMVESNKRTNAERERVFVEDMRQAAIKAGKRCDSVVKYERGALVYGVRDLVVTCQQGKRTVEIKMQADQRPGWSQHELQQLRYGLGDR